MVFKQVEALTFELGVSKDAPVIDFEELKTNPAGISDLINDVSAFATPRRILPGTRNGASSSTFSDAMKSKKS